MDPETDEIEAPHVLKLAEALVAWVEMLNAPEWVREATIASLEGGWVRKVLISFARDAHQRGLHRTSHPTPIIEVPQSASELPTYPPRPPEQIPARSRKTTLQYPPRGPVDD